MSIHLVYAFCCFWSVGSAGFKGVKEWFVCVAGRCTLSRNRWVT